MPDIRYPDGTTRHVYGGPGVNDGEEPDDAAFAREFPIIAGVYRVGPRWVRVIGSRPSSAAWSWSIRTAHRSGSPSGTPSR
jgi:hypothetical protein